MKKLIVILLILTSCGKKNGSTPKPQTTNKQEQGFITFYRKANATTCKIQQDAPTYAKGMIDATYFNYSDTPRTGTNINIVNIDLDRLQVPYTWYDTDISHSEGMEFTVIDKLEPGDMTNPQSGNNYSTHIRLIKSFTITSTDPLKGYFKGAYMQKYIRSGGSVYQVYCYTVDSGSFYIPYIRK